jgi:hypothetical protein
MARGFGSQRSEWLAACQSAFQACAFSHSAISRRNFAQEGYSFSILWEQAQELQQQPGARRVPSCPLWFETTYNHQGREVPRRKPAASLFFLMQLLREIVLDAHFLDRMQLSFQPVDMLFFIDQNLFQQLAGAVVRRFHAGFDSGI